jgi:hypothetical protein
MCYGLLVNNVQGMETQMFATLRNVMTRINTPSTAEVEGLALLARIDDEAAAMERAIRKAEGGADAGMLSVARARLGALKEAAIAARALRPEHIRFSGALACLQQGAVFAPVLGQAATQVLARVA